MIRLTLTLLLQIFVAVAISQNPVFKPYFPADADPSLWEEAWLLVESNDFDAEKTDSVIEVSLERLTADIEPEANLMVTTLLADYISMMSKNPARGRQILENSGEIFSQHNHNDTLNIAWVHRYFMMAYNSVYTRNAPDIATNFQKAYHVLMAFNDNHPLVPVLQYNLMQAFFQIRKVVEGFEYFTPLIEYAEKNENWFFMVNAYLGAGNIIKFYNPGLSTEFLQYAFFLAERYQVDRHLNDPFFYISLGSAYTATDNHQHALEYYTRGLDVLREKNPQNKSLESNFLYYTGVSHGNLGNYAQAIAYLDSSATLERELAGKSINWYRTMGLKGKNLNFAGKFKDALEVNQEVYSFFAETNSKQNAYYYQHAIQELMKSYSGMGEHERALQLGQEAVYSFLGLEVPDDLYSLPNLTQHITPDKEYLNLEEALYLKIDIIRQMALEYENSSLIQSMLEHFEAVTHITDFHASVVNNAETLAALSARFKNNANKLLDGMTMLNASSSQKQDAYMLVTRSKAYLLQTENIRNQYNEVSGSLKESKEENAIRAQLNALLLDNSPEENPKKWEALNKELLMLEKNIFVAGILNPVEPQKVMQQMAVITDFDSVNDKIREDEMVIDFYLTEKYVHTFVISDQSFKAFAREVPENFEDITNNLFRNIKTGNHPRMNQLANEVSQILFEEIETESKSRLVLVPDEKLHALPFDILFIKNQSLLENMAISYRYSSHLFRTSIYNEQPRFKSFLAMAPVFDIRQPLENDYYASQIIQQEEYRDIIQDDEYLAPIPATLEEAETLTRLLSPKGINTKTLLREQATRKNFKNHAPGFDIIHISTHGFSNNHEPEKSGLALYDHIETRHRVDSLVTGLLKLGEISIYDLNADLVVLSACKSGYGAIHKGEGMMGISRGFITAGANNVVASLWKVHDQKTREFMITFYEFLLDGYDYDEALRLAKIDKQKQGWLTLDWAGFILINGN